MDIVKSSKPIKENQSYSILTALLSDIYLWVIPGSNLINHNNITEESILIHSGSTQLLKIPKNCSIIFHQHLIHAGHKTTFYEYDTARRCPRLFCYFHHKNNPVSFPTKTYFNFLLCENDNENRY